VSDVHGGFLVRQHRPWRLWLSLLIVLLLLAVMFLLGRAWQNYELQRLQLTRETLQNRVAELEQRNQALVRRNAQLESSARIEGDAYAEARQSLVALQKEILDLKEQLVFYQGIVSPEKQAFGVHLQSFEIRPKNDMGAYAYKLVLTKQGKSDRPVKGRFDIRFMGIRDGKQQSLDLKAAAGNYREKATAFSFRYFQVFEGELKLPEGFEPYEVVVDVKPTTRKVKPFSEKIPWATATNGGNNP
jgi:cell division protein FtsB